MCVYVCVSVCVYKGVGGLRGEYGSMDGCIVCVVKGWGLIQGRGGGGRIERES